MRNRRGWAALVLVAGLLATGARTNAGINSVPVITSDGGGPTATRNVPENTSPVTTVVATDSDVGDTLTYSIFGGNDGSAFSIGDVSGVLTFNITRNFEIPSDVGSNNVYDVIVLVSDGDDIDTQAIAVTVTDTDEPPSFKTVTAFNVPENQTAITTVFAMDPEGVTPTHSLSGGADMGDFNMTSGGVLTFATAPDFEVPSDANTDNIYEVTLQITDGTFPVTLDITVTVQNAPDGGAPETTLLTKPKTKTFKRVAKFTFSSPTAGADGFECKLDKGAFVDCDSGTFKKKVKLGRHTFTVRALDGLVADQSPVTFKWKVKRRPVS